VSENWANYVKKHASADMNSVIARKLAISPSTITRWINGSVHPEPKQAAEFARAYGRHPFEGLIAVLTRDPDGEERCVACYLCASACPVDCISLQAMVDAKGRRSAEFFRINFSRCIFCGLCEEACPTQAIQLTPDYEMAEYRRKDMVYEKEDLLIAGQGKYPGYNFYRVAGVSAGCAQPIPQGRGFAAAAIGAGFAFRLNCVVDHPDCLVGFLARCHLFYCLFECHVDLLSFDVIIIARMEHL